MTRVAVVTGSNKGIGFGIVELLCQQLDDAVVYITARDLGRGEAALAALRAKLGAEGAKLRLHQLDVTDAKSCQQLAEHLRSEHGGLDVLVNNAGVTVDKSVPIGERADYIMRTNYFGVRQVTDALYPLLRPGARVVMVAGRLGIVGGDYGAETRAALKSPTLTAQQLDALAVKFVQSAKQNKHTAAGFPPDSPLGVSKAFVLAYTTVLARQAAADAARPGVLVNAYCPGWVDTDMNDHRGTMTVQQGADTGVFLATLPPGAPNGLFFAQRRPIQW